MAAAMCGTMPSVQPNAATTLARDPRARPAAMVNSAPVPGEATTMNEVRRNSRVMVAVWHGWWSRGPAILPSPSGRGWSAQRAG